MIRYLLVGSLLLAALGCGGGDQAIGLPPPPPPPPPAPVSAVTIAPDHAVLVPNQTVNLIATVSDASGNPLQGRLVSWSSTTPATATVDANGVVTGLSAGSTTIIALSEGKASAAGIVVKDGAVLGPAGGQGVGAGGKVTVVVPAQALSTGTQITIEPVANPSPDPRLVPGTAYEFGPSGTQFAQPVTLQIKYDPAVLSQAANTAQFRVARLETGGVWTPLMGSTVNVASGTVTGQTSSFSVYAVVEVPVPVASIDVFPANGSILIGGTSPLTATLHDAANGVLSGRPVSWSSSDPTIATVSAAGVVTGVSAGGPVTITAGSEGQTGTAHITVLAPVASVIVAPPSGQVVVGATIQLSAALRDGAGVTLTGRSIVWSSDNPAIATVSVDGVVTGVSPGGPVTVIATSEGRVGSSLLTVLSQVKTVAVNPATRTIHAGETTQLFAILRDAGGNPLSGRPVTWSSSNVSVASVSSNGVVTGVAAGGPVTITAASEGHSGTAQVTVLVALNPVASVTILQSGGPLAIGQVLQLKAIPFDAAGNDLTGRPVLWSSTNPAIASVSPTGVVTGISGGGPVTVTATCEGKFAAVQFTVIPVASVVVFPASTALEPGWSIALEDTLKDASGNALTGRPVVWTSSNPSFMPVSPTGVVTALLFGLPVTITATSEGKSASAQVSVIAPPVIPTVSSFSYQSDIGDFIGAGISETFTLPDADWTATYGNGTINIMLTPKSGFPWSWWWTVYLQAPAGKPIVPGVYEAASRWPFQPTNRPGLSFYGDYRGCNTLSGRFVVYSISIGPGNSLDELYATFEQHCEGMAPAARGTISIVANPWK